MSNCACGKTADTFGGLCGRCAALQTLGLGMVASDAEIEDTYRTLVKVWHPDRFQTDLNLRRAAEEKLKEINAAHDYLSVADTAEKTEFAVEEQEPLSPAENPTATHASGPTQGEPKELERVLKRYERRSAPSILPRIFFAVGGVAALVFLWVVLDLVLSSNPATRRSWEESKAELSRDVHSTFVRLTGSVAESSQGQHESTPQPAAQPVQTEAPAPASKAKTKSGGETRAAAPAKAVGGAKPYITSGLTPMEVLAVLGSPTTSSGEKMFYNSSEIDFRDGHVAGWNIDQKTPIRVKLWPDQPVVAGVQAYAIGSSKSDVIALQGTPTYFSDNEFGYGRSRVYFKNDHVVGWKDDPASTRLRVVAQ